MSKDAVYEGTRTVRTFVELRHGASTLLENAKDNLKGSTYTIMASLLMSAFAFEAYLNDLGQDLVDDFDVFDQKRVMDKYAELCSRTSVVPAFGVRPHQTLKGLFKYRNAIAHGKSEILHKRAEISSAANPHEHAPRPFWEEYCTLQNAERACMDITAVIHELHNAAGKGKHPFAFGATISTLTKK